MWQQQNNQLHQQFVFKDFDEAFAFMQQAAKVIQEHNHHPFWTNNYHIVDIYLTTHDQGNAITDKDVVLAAAIDAVFEAFK